MVLAEQLLPYRQGTLEERSRRRIVAIRVQSCRLMVEELDYYVD
jgi:hypothetical protein